MTHSDVFRDIKDKNGNLMWPNNNPYDYRGITSVEAGGISEVTEILQFSGFYDNNVNSSNIAPLTVASNKRCWAVVYSAGALATSGFKIKVINVQDETVVYDDFTPDHPDNWNEGDSTEINTLTQVFILGGVLYYVGEYKDAISGLKAGSKLYKLTYSGSYSWQLVSSDILPAGYGYLNNTKNSQPTWSYNRNVTPAVFTYNNTVAGYTSQKISNVWGIKATGGYTSTPPDALNDGGYSGLRLYKLKEDGTITVYSSLNLLAPFIANYGPTSTYSGWNFFVFGNNIVNQYLVTAPGPQFFIRTDIYRLTDVNTDPLSPPNYEPSLLSSTVSTYNPFSNIGTNDVKAVCSNGWVDTYTSGASSATVWRKKYFANPGDTDMSNALFTAFSYSDTGLTNIQDLRNVVGFNLSTSGNHTGNGLSYEAYEESGIGKTRFIRTKENGSTPSVIIKNGFVVTAGFDFESKRCYMFCLKSGGAFVQRMTVGA